MTRTQRSDLVGAPRAAQPRTLLGSLVLAGALLGSACGGGGSSSSPAPGPSAPGSLAYQNGVSLVSPGAFVTIPAPSVVGDVTSWSIDPALPAGLTLSSVDGSISGVPTEAPGRVRYTITATNDAGSTSGDVVIDIAPPVRFALVTHQDEGVFGRYLVDGADGDLKHRGFVAQDPAETEPEALVLTPDGRFGFAANDGSGDLSSYAIDLDSGELTHLHTQPLSSGPYHLAVHPGGEALYVAAAGAGRLESFAIDGASGALTAIGAAQATAVAPSDLDVSPDGDFLVVTHASIAKLESYAIDAATKSPSFSSSYQLSPGSPNASGLAIAPFGGHVYAVFDDLDLIAHFTAEAGTGDLTLVGAGMPVAPDSGPSAVTVHPDGKNLYVLNKGSNSMTRYAIDADTGALTRGEAAALPESAESFTIEPRGRFGYLVDEETHTCTRVLLHAATGVASLENSVRTRRLPGPLTLVSGQGPLDLVPSHLFVANAGSDDVSVLEIGAGGSLTSLPPNAPTGDFPNGLAVDPRGRFAFVANTADATISRYAIDTNGGFDELLPAAACDPGPFAMTVDPSGRFLYVITRGNEGLQSFRIASDGGLTPIEALVSGTNGAAVAVDPSGQYLYVAIQGNRTSGNSGRIDIYAIDPHDGTLDARTPSGAAPGGPASLAFSPGGGMLYSALEKADHLAPYVVSGDQGTLNPLSPGSVTGDEPTDLWIHPSGLYAYVAVRQTPGFGRIDLYDLRPSDGALFDADNGTLTARANFAFHANPYALTGTPDGTTVYSLHRGIGTVAVLRFDDGSGDPSTAGHLTVESTVAVGTDPSAMRMLTTLE